VIEENRPMMMEIIAQISNMLTLDSMDTATVIVEEDDDEDADADADEDEDEDEEGMMKGQLEEAEEYALENEVQTQGPPAVLYERDAMIAKHSTIHVMDDNKMMM
jgi:hypothetical protein